MNRWKLTIEYEGSGFAGWQRQENALSVQQAIEEAITKFCQQELRIHAAGRTDAGVHARGQVAHFDLDYGNRPLDGESLAKALNAHLRPLPISIVSAQEADENFHARFSARNKLYTYRILCRSAPAALENGRLWQIRRGIDVKAMRAAAAVLIGHHDFTTFRDSQCQARSPVKTLDILEIEQLAYDDFGGVELRIHAQARSFLHHQVRNMVGSLVLVGEGKWSPADLRAALEAKDRTRGGPTAPAEGLYLMRVDY